MVCYLTFYIARPTETTVLVSSTTRDELDLRIWGEMVMFWREAKEQFDWVPGFLTDSKQMITTDGKDSEFGRDRRSGILGRPCKIGQKWLIGSGTSPFVGIKNDYVYFAGDEAGLMPVGFIDSFANLSSNPHFSAAILGNLGDLDTPLGTICEPRNGWDSIPDTDVARVFDTRWSNGRAVQFIGTDSPNLDYPEGAEPYPKIIGRRYLKQLEQDYGKDTPLYNMFAAGKIPRGTMQNRVITKDVCLRNQAFDEITWGHEPITKLYAMDISYLADHGDRTVGRPLAFGKDNEGNLRLALVEPPLIYTPNDRASGSIEEQLATQCMAECKRLGIPPSKVFFDGTGRQQFHRSTHAPMVNRSRPNRVRRSATNRPNFVGRRYHEDKDYRRKEGDLLPCNEVFGKMVTELWFALRAVVDAKQLRGLDMETIKEAEKRLWKVTAGNRIDVEIKAEIKLRIGRSPDLADCLVVGLEGARRLGFELGKLQSETKRRSQWFKQLQRDYDEAVSPHRSSKHNAMPLLNRNTGPPAASLTSSRNSTGGLPTTASPSHSKRRSSNRCVSPTLPPALTHPERHAKTRWTPTPAPALATIQRGALAWRTPLW